VNNARPAARPRRNAWRSRNEYVIELSRRRAFPRPAPVGPVPVPMPDGAVEVPILGLCRTVACRLDEPAYHAFEPRPYRERPWITSPRA